MDRGIELEACECWREGRSCHRCRALLRASIGLVFLCQHDIELFLKLQLTAIFSMDSGIELEACELDKAACLDSRALPCAPMGLGR
jgi:hypothetical protein